jgi:hypothetical protein
MCRHAAARLRIAYAGAALPPLVATPRATRIAALVRSRACER